MVGKKKKSICVSVYLWHAYPLPCVFPAGGLSRVMSVGHSEGWGLVSEWVRCTPSPLRQHRRGRDSQQGPTVHSPANLHGMPVPGRALASRSEHVFMPTVKVHALLLKPGM